MTSMLIKQFLNLPFVFPVSTIGRIKTAPVALLHKIKRSVSVSVCYASIAAPFEKQLEATRITINSCHHESRLSVRVLCLDARIMIEEVFRQLIILIRYSMKERRNTIPSAPIYIRPFFN